MPYTLTLTDHEAHLVERALRRQTKQMSDAEHVAVGRIADRLLRDIIHGPPVTGGIATMKDGYLVGERSLCIYATGEADFLKDGERRWAVMDAIDHTTKCTGTVTRQSDEYACSCGARWDVGDDHP